MKFEEVPAVSPAKIADLKSRIQRLNIDLSLIDETFVKGSGKGGQKINKTSNAVLLKYAPLNIVVKNQRERQRSLNRFLALRELVDRIEQIVSPQTSRRLEEWNRLRKKKGKPAKKLL